MSASSNIVTDSYRARVAKLDPDVRADAERLATALHAEDRSSGPGWTQLPEHDRLAWTVSAARWLRVARSIGLT